MRNYYLRCLIAISVLVCSFNVKAQFPLPYCAETYPSNVEPITKVVFAGINNTTSATLNGTPAHENFTAISGSVIMGQNYTIDVQGNTDGAFTTFIRLFVDWNNDNDFTDAGESFDIGTIANSTGTDGITASATIAIPTTATAGALRMRVSKRWNVFPAPCNNAGFGQSEDYTLNVIPQTPCSGIPNPGTATATPTAPCVNPVVLKSTGATIAAGVNYQWQVSTTSATGPFTDVAGATAVNASANQSFTSWYRLRAICTNGTPPDTAYSNVVNVVSPPIPFGTYTIGAGATTWPGGTNFATFTEAVNAMSCGIAGPVTFNVTTATYNTQVIIPFIANTSATNTVTFNGNGSTLTFATTAAERAVIKLKGADYMRFNNFIINPTGAANGYGVQLVNNADSNIVSNCTINVNATSTATSFAGIVISGSETDAIGTGTTSALCDGNEFRNNTVNGGYYGITLSATFAGGANGYNKFIGNDVKDFYQYGMYVQGSYSTTIDSNNFRRPTRTNSANPAVGIYFTNQSNTATISRNRITNPFGGFAAPATQGFNGIEFNAATASSGNDNIVVNNLIGAITGNGQIFALNNTGSGNVSYFHNTISLDNAASTAGVTRGFNQSGAASGVVFYNNVVSITRGGTGAKHAIYLGTNLLQAADYNDYYVNATNGNLGFFGSNKATLAAWRTATAASFHDVNSWDLNPVFNSPSTGDYCIANAGIDNKGLYIGVDFDIKGAVRSFTGPDMGAFECTPPPCSIPPVTGTTVVNPTTICEGNSVILNLNIGAYGSGQTFQWQWADDATPGVFNNLGNPKLTPDTTINADSTVWLRVKISCSSADEFTTPVLLNVNPLFRGAYYTIDNTQPTAWVPGQYGGVFHTFNEAYNAMAACGIDGPVVFDVYGNSPYNEQLKMDSIKGASALKTITFNGNGRVITFNTPPTNTERAVIKLTHADHIIFDSLTIDASTGTNYGYGVQLINNADSNVFRKCTIISSTTQTSTGYAGIVINATDAGPVSPGNTFCDDNLFDKNTITGGYYGVTLVGNTGALVDRNKFTNNTITEFYSAGFYVAGSDNTLIEGNIMERPTRSIVASAVYGVYATAVASNNLRISKNRIRNLTGGVSTLTTQQYGIYFNSVGAAVGSQNVVSNNVISNLGGLGLIYALYNIGSANIHYYHNTISIDSTTSTATAATRGFYQQTATTGVEFKNNIITITRGGTGVKNAIYIDNNTSDVISDYNDFYVNATNAHIGWYNGANRTSFNDWKTNSGKDANSLNIDPLYQNPGAGDYRPSIQTVDNLGTTTTSIPITTDILNVVRNNPPDMGAFEFTPLPCVTPPVAGTASVTPNTGICLQVPITLNVTGHSPLGTLTFQWQTATSAAGPWTNIGPLLYGPRFDTLTMVTTFFRAEVSCGASHSYTAPVQVNLNQVVVAGTYTIGNGATTWNGLAPVAGVNDNFATFQESVSAMLCGITGSVVFNVVPGTYTEQIRIPNIRNTSALNTVTYQSQNGSPTSVNLTWASTSAASNYTLRLDTASYFRFRNMTISATDATFGRAVDFTGLASYDSIVGCNITVPAVTTTANSVAGIYASAFKGVANTLKGNTITNGAMGIYWWGTSAAVPSVDHLIDGNTISGAYFYGIWANNQKNLKVQNNTVNVTAPLSATSYGIYMNECDSSYEVLKNRININNATTGVYGIYLNNDHKALTNGLANIFGNTIIGAGNTGNLWGLYINNASVTGTSAHEVRNNAISISTTATTSYGIYNNNTASGNYYNNTVNNSSPNGTTTNAAARFENSTAGAILLRNNIFSHKGGGRALYVNSTNDPQLSNYNMLYTTGAVLAQRGSPAGNFANLAAWRTGSNNDKYSIVYTPALVSNTDPRPDTTNPDVWAIHGRGIQIPGNSFDINGNYRAQILTEGAPDLGAYEFPAPVLTAPTVLTGTPAVPAQDVTQVFMYGTDTVMKVKWGPNFPATATAQRYSGVVPVRPPGYPANDSMYFYTQLNVPNGTSTNYDFKMQLSYIDPWQGSIPDQYQIGLGRRTGGAWVVGFNSRVNTQKKTINDTTANITGLAYQFTGFINPYAPPVLPDKDSSNTGRRFWVAYAINQLAGGQDMVLYLSAQQTANVQVKINGTSWIRNYTVPAGTVTVTETLPKTGPQNAFLNAAGLFDQGISIESDEPIVAYGHCYGAASSGAVMLLPVGVWGYEYKTLSITQNYGAGSFSYFYVIADNDNTVVEINPTVAVSNPGMTPGTPYTVTLNKGQVFQVVASSQTTELTGSTVKSVPNSAGKCYPIATFSGSSRTGIDQPCAGGGDFIMQQNFPTTAWGKRYLTANTSASTAANNFQGNKFRIAVKDPNTVVKRNGTQIPLASLISSHYYEYVSTTADYIESDRPIMVAQYMSGACTGVGDPEMMYISPIEQGIKQVAFYRNTNQAITQNYVTLIVPNGGTGLSSLVIKDGATVQVPDVIIPHPNLAGYSVVVKGWPSAQQQVTVTSDSAFTGITYGQGTVESYGYNVGTLVKNINALATIRDTFSILAGQNDFTCAGSPLHFTAYLPVIPTKLTWKFSNVPGLSPNTDTTINPVVPTGTTYINGTLYYKFALTTTYYFANPGIYTIQIEYEHPDIESCDHKGIDVFYVQVVPTPKTNFNVAFSGCEGDVASFTGEATTANGVTVNHWDWTFHDNTTALGQTATYTYNTPGVYNVKLHTITPDGCVGDSIKPITVNARPTISVIADSIAVCPGADTVFKIQSPLAGATYNWYTTAIGGTAITTGSGFIVGPSGTTLTVQGVTTAAEYWIEAISAQNCTSVSRKRVKVEVLPMLSQAVPTVTGATATTVTFSWPAVPGAASYQVAINGSSTFITPSSGATGLTHTVTGLGTLDKPCIVVKAIGVIACQTSTSVSVCGCANSPAAVVNANISVCTGTPATFTVQSPIPGFTYNWYGTLTGGTILGTGSTFTSPSISGTTSFYVEQVGGTGCIGSPRTQVTATILAPLAQPVVTVADADRTVNSITFRWTAVPGAASYLVSVNGGAFVVPSSGSTGLSHTVTGLNPLQQACIVVRAVGTITCQNSESASVCSTARPDAIFIPNTFTPNGDGKNDALTAYGFAIQSIQFMVFNQWGEKIHEVNTSAQNGATGGFVLWDGKYQGKVQPVGVYVYAAKIILKDGTVINKSGALNIVR